LKHSEVILEALKAVFRRDPKDKSSRVAALIDDLLLIAPKQSSDQFRFSPIDDFQSSDAVLSGIHFTLESHGFDQKNIKNDYSNFAKQLQLNNYDYYLILIIFIVLSIIPHIEENRTAPTSIIDATSVLRRSIKLFEQRGSSGEDLAAGREALLQLMDAPGKPALAASFVEALQLQRTAQSPTRIPLPEVPPALFVEKWNPSDTDNSLNAKGETREQFDQRRAMERPKGDTIITYLQRHYGPHVDPADETHEPLSRPALEKLDPSAYRGLYTFLRSNDLPESIHIPTKSELVRAELDQEPSEADRASWREYERRRSLKWVTQKSSR